MENTITQIQTRYIARRKAIDASINLFGLSRTMEVARARKELRDALLPLVVGPRAGETLERMILDAVDMYELEAAAALNSRVASFEERRGVS